MRLARTVTLAFLVVLAFVFLFLMWRPAAGHEWLPDSCCHGRDCWAIEDNEVSSENGLFTIKATGQIIPFNDPMVKWGENPTMKFWRCTNHKKLFGVTHCLFPPPAGT